jgi:hypothetical protein
MMMILLKINSKYPKLTSTIIDTVINRFSVSDIQEIKDYNNWIKLYKLIKTSKFKYR